MAGALDQITAVVVLMLENCSFDRMLGFLQSDGYPIAGLSGAETVPMDPADPRSPRVRVTRGVTYRDSFKLDPANARTTIDPAHDFASVQDQILRGSGDGTPTNQGFIWSYAQVRGNTPAHARTLVACFAPEQLPVLTTLAREYAVCDHWFSAVPGPTWPNRLFVHAGTSAGHVDDTAFSPDYNVETIYDRLAARGLEWKIYFHDFPQALCLGHLQREFCRGQFQLFPEFLEDAAQGTLPAYSFIEPRYTDFLFVKANDQHPPHDVALGEHLIADVYEALRHSPQWEQSLLVIVYDEHGGLYDHVPPPAGVNPDGRTNPASGFNFERLGVRVPAVLVSPYIARGTIDPRVYDHTSVLATLEKRFALAPLTRRDAAAASFEANLSLATPRTDTLLRLPRPADPVSADAHRRSSIVLNDLTAETVKDALKALNFSQVAISELQAGLVKLTKNLAMPGEDEATRVLRLAGWADTEHDAAQVIRQFSSLFFGQAAGAARRTV